MAVRPSLWYDRYLTLSKESIARQADISYYLLRGKHMELITTETERDSILAEAAAMQDRIDAIEWSLAVMSSATEDAMEYRRRVQ